MSVVAVYITPDKIIFGADTQATYGYHKIVESYYGKIFEINGMYVGGSGTSFELQFFRRFLEEKNLRSGYTENDFNDLMLEFYDHFRARTKNESATIQNHYILIHDAKAFIFKNWLIREVEEFAAIGSGGETARTAFEVFKQLDRSPDMEKILQVACKIDLHCHEPLKIYEIHKSQS